MTPEVMGDGTASSTQKRADSFENDAFGRLRTSEINQVFESKHLYSKGDDFWEELLVNGGTATYDSNKVEVGLAVTGTTGSRTVRRSTRYLPYSSGLSSLIAMTGTMGTSTGVRFVVRSNTSGGVVDTPYERSTWDDPMDGTGRSGITLDFTKSMILLIDFQYLGVGRIRFGFDIGGVAVLAHSVENANLEVGVYMGSPTLPVSYEILNDGANVFKRFGYNDDLNGLFLEGENTVGVDSITEICSTVFIEGGSFPLGFEFSASRGIDLASVTTRQLVMLVRLKNSFAGKPNRRTAKFNRASFWAQTNNAFIEIAHIRKPSAIDAAWNDVAAEESSVEFAITDAATTGLPSVTGGDNHSFTSEYTIGKGGADSEFGDDNLSKHSFISQNFDSTGSELFGVYATKNTIAGGNSDIGCSIEYTEFS